MRSISAGLIGAGSYIGRYRTRSVIPPRSVMYSRANVDLRGAAYEMWVSYRCTAAMRIVSPLRSLAGKGHVVFE